MILLDTTFLIDFLRKKKNAIKKAEELVARDNLCTTYVNFYELLIGVYSENVTGQEEKIREVENLMDKLEVFSLEKKSANYSAKIGGALSIEGRMVGDMDNMIAGIALSNNVSIIVTRDKEHFSRIKGLKIEDY